MTTEPLLSARHDACYILKHRSQAKGWLIAGGQGTGSISLGGVFPKTEHMAGTQKATSEKEAQGEKQQQKPPCLSSVVDKSGGLHSFSF